MTATKRTIALLFHARDRHRDLTSYTVVHLVPFWRDAGYDVRFLFGTREKAAADLVFVHVDLSVVPDEYLEFAARYPVAVNGRVKDIRKSTFSQNLVRPEDPWNGKVIVKSDLNSAGRPERMQREPEWLKRHDRLVRAFALLNRAVGRQPPFMTTSDYQVYDRIAEVPRRCWRNQHLVVERFLPEIEAGCFHTRIFQFLGDRFSCSRLVATDPIVNVPCTIRMEDVEPHPEIMAWRQRLGMDYGKLDYGVVDGKVVLYDVNKTTGSARGGRTVGLWALRRDRALGIDSFFA
jgi:hypothetical protein